MLTVVNFVQIHVIVVKIFHFQPHCGRGGEVRVEVTNISKTARLFALISSMPLCYNTIIGRQVHTLTLFCITLNKFLSMYMPYI